MKWNMPIESPCIDVCVLEKNTCKGCGRTIQEIGSWRELSDEEKMKIIERLKTDLPKGKVHI